MAQDKQPSVNEDVAAEATPPQKPAQTNQIGGTAPQKETLDTSMHPTAAYTEASSGAKPNDAYLPIDNDASRLNNGSVFGKYRVAKLLGEGAMGAVYLATDTQLDRSVALKIPKLVGSDPAAVHDRFLREAKAVATIQHPNICPIYEYGDIAGQTYLAMAFIKGAPLTRYLRSGKPIPQRQACLLVRKLALALQEAHTSGVIHRDLKPANIMIDRRKEPIVMDFGLARRDRHDDTRLTQTGAFIGTPAYTSPEQIRNEPGTVGPKTDIYALAVILYELLTGVLPFEGTTMASVLGQILADDPQSPRSRNPDVSETVNAICMRAMAKNPDDRFESMAAFAGSLTNALRGDTAAVDVKPTHAALDEAAAASRRIGGLAVAETSLQDASDSELSVPRPVVQETRAEKKSKMSLWFAAASCSALIAVTLVIVFGMLNRPGRVVVEFRPRPFDGWATIDNEPVEVAQLQDGFPLAAGKHELVVGHEGIADIRQQFDTYANQRTRLEIRVPVVAGSAADADHSEPAATPIERVQATPSTVDGEVAHTIQSSGETSNQATASSDPKKQSALPGPLGEQVNDDTATSVPSTTAGHPLPKVFEVGVGRGMISIEEALERAVSGDTIEIATNQPIVATQQLVWEKQGSQPLTIRAAKGYRPVLVFPPKNQDGVGEPNGMPNLRLGSHQTKCADVILDGLTIVRTQGEYLPVVACSTNTVINNCVLLCNSPAIWSGEGQHIPELTVRNCYFAQDLGARFTVTFILLSKSNARIENCLFVANGFYPVQLNYDARTIVLNPNPLPDETQARLSFSNNTIVGSDCLFTIAAPWNIACERNLFVGGRALVYFGTGKIVVSDLQGAKKLLAEYQGRNNLFSGKIVCQPEFVPDDSGLRGWRQLVDEREVDPILHPPRFLNSEVLQSPVTRYAPASTYRLHPATEASKNLGADLDAVPQLPENLTSAIRVPND